MATAEKTVSALINRQLPDFVRAGSPQYKRFLELYYEWLEDEAAGNTVYHILESGKYRDVDETLDPFIRLFKKELLPYFPETSTLDLVKILKGAREFYVKKGSVESVQWLFRTLFGEDIEVYYPKEQILIASDGKWKLPQAFNLTLSAENQDLDVNLLEKHKAEGSISKATCVIESANKTIDSTFGNEILELYVSNVDKEFTNGENLIIEYVDENGVVQTFSERIIGSISGITVDSNKRGTQYRTGDPIVIYGGLATTAEANDAVAVVGNVTVGSVEDLAIAFGGYGYRTYKNTEAIVYAGENDDPAANQSTDIRVIGINEIIGSTSQNSYGETLEVDLMPIEYLINEVLANSNWEAFDAHLAEVQANTGSAGEVWIQHEHAYANGGSFETANFTCKIATSNTGWLGGPANLILYNIANTEPLTTAGFLVGQNTLIGVESGATLNVSAIINEDLDVNLNTEIGTALNYETLDTGAVALYQIINGGYGFVDAPTIGTESYYDTIWSSNIANVLFDLGYTEAQVLANTNYRAYRQQLGAFGKIAHIYIDNPGTGYSNGDPIFMSGRGYGFSGNVTVDANGSIISTTIINRGEGYTGGTTLRNATVDTANGGSGAVLTAYGFGEGVEVEVGQGEIGRIRDVRMVSRGFDYITEPGVSFKVVDMMIEGVGELENLSEGERVYQGATLETADFQGIVKSFTRSNGLLRLYNYSGRGNFNESIDINSEGGVTFTVNAAANVPAPSSYPLALRTSGLSNPYWYGGSIARGTALFYQGLIAFPGFYLNTDGFPSSDKRLQDGRVYQNYSYVVESEKSLAEYQNSLQDISHPIGMLMLSRTITRSQLFEDIKTDSVVYLNPDIAENSTISVACTFSNVVTGSNTFFANGAGNTGHANVGDMLYIRDYDHSRHNQVKIITAVNSNTELEVEGDFTIIGYGRVSLEAGNDVAVISGTNVAPEWFLATGDEVRVNTGGVEVFTVISVSPDTFTLNTTAGNTVSNVVYIVAPDYSGDFDYEIITVE
jgi:hypothetical protein